ncbi:MAG: flippase [Candidatus Zixiibacteriota bacterium]|nr:MAG: flippase [candidate division Zixibacteria bacterium]
MAALGRQLLKNIFSSWGGYVVRLVITFFFVPYIAGVFGDARYGVWVIVFQTIAYFSLLDLGLSSALTRYVSRYLSERDFPAINRVLSTSSALYLVIGSAVFGGIYLFVHLFFGYFRIGDPGLVEEGKRALLVLGGFMAFNSYLLPWGNSLAAFQRHDITRLLAVFEELIRVVVMVWLIREGYGLMALALVILFASVAKHLVGGLWLRKLYPQVRLSGGGVTSATARMLLGYSKISFGITIGWLIIFNADTFLLGLLSSSAAAGVYNPGAQLMLYLRNIVNSIGIPLTPAISHVEAGGEMDKVRSVYLRGVKYVSYVSYVFLVGVVIYARPFVRLWLPAEFSEAATVMIILSFGAAIFLPQIIGNSVLFGIGQHRYILRTLVFESLAKIVLSVILIPKYDLVGMALANAVPQLVLYVTLFPYFMSRVLAVEMRKIVGLGLATGMLGAVVSLPAALIVSRLLPPTGWGSFAANVATVVAGSVFVGYFLLEKGDRQKLTALLNRSA